MQFAFVRSYRMRSPAAGPCLQRSGNSSNVKKYAIRMEGESEESGEVGMGKCRITNTLNLSIAQGSACWNRQAIGKGAKE
ncbi:MAG: hypothetical protein CL946_05235 [Ectothiorhodospiraceae bacterium]|nr:hypothetical protein [Ectothiorhodospiraceae bacterium]